MKIPTTKEIVRKLFRDDSGEPFELTDGQVQIFNTIWKRKNRRTRIIAATRYGKSRTISMALVLRAVTFSEKWAIVAPTTRKAKIIMGYALDHALQNKYTRETLELDKDEDLDRLRRERSKNRLTFKTSKGIGEILILSAEGHRVSNKGEALMGFGSPNVVLDESSLIDDYTYATVKRMLMDAKEGDSCLVEIGNPFYKNHFERIGRDTEYKKIFIDWRQAVVEGRFTEKDIEEAKQEALFDILYECKFPDQDIMDEEGWSALLLEDDITKAKERGRDLNGFGQPKLGVDVARGGACWNAWVLRYNNVAFIRRKDKGKNTMDVAGRTAEILNELSIPAPFCFIDSVGVGAGVVDRMREQKMGVAAFVAGEKAQNVERFYNRRAEAYWRLREWILAGGALSDDEEWDELLDIRYKVASDRRIIIMSKDEMAKRGIVSPDCADALALTFGTIDTNQPTLSMTLQARELLDERLKRRRQQKGNVLKRI